MSYQVKSPLKHDGILHKIFDVITLKDEHAKPLLDAGIIEPAPAAAAAEQPKDPDDEGDAAAKAAASAKAAKAKKK